MTQLLFVLPAVEPGDSVRVDTASGSNTPATVYGARGGAVVGPTFHADPSGALPHIYGADGVTTLYLKHLNYKGTVTGSPVTLTGVDDSVAPPTTNAASPVNYCRLAVSISGALTVGNPGHLVTASELSIVSQHGTDFSIDEDAGGGGVVRSAAGGRFQACFYIGPGFSSSFDESSTATRYYWYGYTTGELDSAVNPLVGLGLDGFVPANVDLNFADTHASAPGDCPPGGIAFQNFGIFASGLTGTDSLSLDGVTLGAVWQIA